MIFILHIEYQLKIQQGKGRENIIIFVKKQGIGLDNPKII